jgi:ornithine carbamoyltransferase
MAPVRSTAQPQAQPKPPVSGEERNLLDQARALRQAAAEGRLQPLLRGKHLCLLCDDDSLPAARLFCQAATELGAKVTHIGMSLNAHSDAQEVEHTARVLGRLYDAVECQGLDSALVQQMARAAGIAVYDALAAKDPRIGRIAELLADDGGTGDDTHRIALQALLLHTIV